MIDRLNWAHTEIFDMFKGHVLKHRASKFIEADHPKIFDADVFNGIDAKDIGLIDEIGDMHTILKAKHGDCDVINFSKRSKWEKIAEGFS